jgi:hypothetical protein
MNDGESQRLKILLDNASANLTKAIADINQGQIDAANGRTAYFVRLTIGAGAVIAAIVSFLGGHASTLHPEWLLRCSLVSLTLAMLAGLYRGHRYPCYILQDKKVIWDEAARHYQKIKGENILASSNPVDLHTGNFINKEKLSKEYGLADTELDTEIKNEIKKRERLLKEWQSAEVVCLFAVGFAMVSLVWLALCTF